MERSVLKVRLREEIGKGRVRRLRKRGIVPAILYGPHLKTGIPLEIGMIDLRKLISSLSGEERIITLQFTEENEVDSKEVIIKDTQYNWLKGEMNHLDFYEITRGEKISTRVPVRLVGESAGIKKGGVTEQMVREVEVECLPENIPAHIDVDIKELDIGDSVRVKGLQVSPTVKILTNPEEIVISILSPISEEELQKLEEEGAVEAEEVEVIEKERKEEEPTQQEE